MRRLYTTLLACIVLAVLTSGCSGHVEKDRLNDTDKQSWPRLFDIDNLSQYEYNMINGTTNMPERQLKVSYSDSEYVYTFANGTKGGGPTEKTSVRMTWLNEDRVYGADIQDNISDGRPISLIIYSGNKRAAHSIAPLTPMDSADSMAHNSWLIFARSCDLAHWFDVEKDESLHVSGFDILSYNDSAYYCQVYQSNKDPVFKAWRNTSIPAPLKIIAYFNATRTDVPEVWTFELLDWG